MRKLFLIPLMIVLVSGLVLGGCAKPAPAPAPTPAPAPAPKPPAPVATPAPSPAPTKAIELSLNLPIPPTHDRWKKALEPWLKEVENRSGGRVKIVPYFAEAMSKAADHYDSIVAGTADMGESTTGKCRAGLFTLWETVDGCALAGYYPKNINPMELYNKSPALQNEFKQTKVLFLHQATVAELGTSKKPIKTMADLKGQKINILASKLTADKVEALGASVVKIPMADVYMALEKGVVDGTTLTYELVVARKFGEVVKHITVNIPTTGGGIFYVVMNWGAWNKLPADIQKIFDELSGVYAQNLFGNYWWNTTIDAQKQFVGEFRGTTYHWSQEDMTKVNELWKPVIEKQITEMEGKGYPARAMIEEYWQLQKKYSVPPPF